MSTFVNSLGRPNINTVSLGGTGVNVSTPYSVACAGISGISPVQFLASVGSSGAVLTSAGASALPAFSALSGGSGTIAQIVGARPTPLSGAIPSAYTNSLVQASITPTSTASTILILGALNTGSNVAGASSINCAVGVQLWRGGSSIVDFGNGAESQFESCSLSGAFLSFYYSFSLIYYDSPATTSSTTYSYYVNNTATPPSGSSNAQMVGGGGNYIYLVEVV